MLVHSGSVICVEPASLGLRANGTPNTFLCYNVVNKGALRCYSKYQRMVELNGKKFSFTFVVADVSKSIIGADFLNFFGFSVDFYNGQLTYHPGTPHQQHTPFKGYHRVSWNQGEVHTVGPGPWMQPAIHISTKCWPGAARTTFTDGAETPKAKEQQTWHPKFAKILREGVP